MYLSMVILILLRCGGSLADNTASQLNTDRIVGGEEIEISEAKYHVGVENFGVYRCGAALIEFNVAITAAHCITNLDPYFMTVFAGTKYKNGENGLKRKVKKLVQHELYDDYMFDYDIALIFLETNFNPTANISVIKLADVDDHINYTRTGFISGWGATEEGISNSKKLYGVNVPLVEYDSCTELYEEWGGVTGRMICAGDTKNGDVGACHGDAGGPLVIDNKLYGIASWGYGCARPEYPGVYTSISYMNTWIQQQIHFN